MEYKWSEKTTEEVFKLLAVHDRGLAQNDALLRLKEFGPNKLPEDKVKSLPQIFIEQFRSPLIYVLIAAAAAVFYTGHATDGYIILSVLLFNSVVGTIQEGKAQNTLRALKAFTKTNATVLRDDKEMIIADTEVVPGDIIILSQGAKVPADARVIISKNLLIDESTLTGESKPVHKTTEENVVFKGTHIVGGEGKAIVTATGLESVIGKIAKEIETVDSEIPLKTDIRYLSKLIIQTVILVSALLFFYGIFICKPAEEMFAPVVALLVSIIPEALPIVMTLVLATGVWRMSKKNALIKKLQAVEALGQARVIAVDKTGTITRNEMVIQQVFVNNMRFEIGGAGYEPAGDIKLGDKVIDPANHPDLLLAGKISVLTSNAQVIFSEKEGWQVSGDPTEAAMTQFGHKVGFHRDDVEREDPLIEEIPFDYKLKYHAAMYKQDKANYLTVAGAPEVILNLSKKIWRDGNTRALSAKDKEGLESIFFEMSRNGLRVIALAQNASSAGNIFRDDMENLTFVGFVGMKDGLRPEVASAMQKAKTAGIRVVMITGDHKISAEVIGREAGIYHDGDISLTGEEIDKMADKELSDKLIKTSIFARVTPEHKLRIINAYKKRGEIIAMTGDGVNDAPSLVAADLGVAMGKIGTEVAKEAADIVLLDDNFGNIISAVEEGRSIYKTIKKVILYLFSTSIGEALTIAGALFVGLPLPILPAQIIWLNLVTDGFLDMALAMEPKEEGLLSGNFERPKKSLIDAFMVRRMMLMALPMAIGTLILFNNNFAGGAAKAWTISLTLLAVFQWFNAWNCRSESKSIFRMNPLSNKYLVGATVAVISLQLFALYNPLMQKILNTHPLSASEWLLIALVASSVIIVEEARKIISCKIPAVMPVLKLDK